MWRGKCVRNGGLLFHCKKGSGTVIRLDLGKGATGSQCPLSLSAQTDLICVYANLEVIYEISAKSTSWAIPDPHVLYLKIRKLTFTEKKLSGYIVI